MAKRTLPATAKLEVAQAFGDRLVLQREMPVPVWGTADPGERVVVSFAGQKVEATVDAVRAGCAARAGGEEKVEIPDVLVGEVWLGSGQSNRRARCLR